MPIENSDFKFQIGQIVYHRLHSKDNRTQMVVVSRLLEQCEGGIQHLYRCRMGLSAYAHPFTLDPNRLYDFQEIEIEE